MTQQLSGKVALITGGGSGIGRVTALALARAGAQVVVADVDGERAAATCQQIQSAVGTVAHFVQVDVTNAAQVAAMIEQAVQSMVAWIVPLTTRASSVRPLSLPPTTAKMFGIGSLTST